MNDFPNLSAFLDALPATTDGEHLYCLVDHAGMPGVAKRLDAAGIVWQNLLDGSNQHVALAAAPLLFSLATDGAQCVPNTLVAWLADHGEYASSVVLMRSSLPLDRMAAQLRLRLDATLADGSVVLLRFYDPRVLAALRDVLSAQQLHWTLAPARAWWLVRRDGKVEPVQGNRVAPAPAADQLLFSEAQEFALLEASEPDQIEEQIKRNLPEAYAAIAPEQRYSFIVRQQGASAQFGIRSTRDMAMFCSVALMLGEQFHALPLWRDVLDKVAAGTVDFVDTVAAMQDDYDSVPS